MQRARLMRIFLAVAFFAVIGMVSGQAYAFVVHADELGNGTFTDATGLVSNFPGSLANDPSSPLGNVLTYFFPVGIAVGNGDVLVLDGTAPSDALRFTDANGSLNGITADRMIFYSLKDGIELADTGLPGNLGTGATGGPVQEQPDGSFFYDAGSNQYYGQSSPSTVPEPTTLLLLGSGLIGLAGLARRRAR